MTMGSASQDGKAVKSTRRKNIESLGPLALTSLIVESLHRTLEAKLPSPWNAAEPSDNLTYGIT